MGGETRDEGLTSWTLERVPASFLMAKGRWGIWETLGIPYDTSMNNKVLTTYHSRAITIIAFLLATERADGSRYRQTSDQVLLGFPRTASLFLPHS